MATPETLVEKKAKIRARCKTGTRAMGPIRFVIYPQIYCMALCRDNTTSFKAIKIQRQVGASTLLTEIYKLYGSSIYHDFVKFWEPDINQSLDSKIELLFSGKSDILTETQQLNNKSKLTTFKSKDKTVTFDESEQATIKQVLKSSLTQLQAVIPAHLMQVTRATIKRKQDALSSIQTTPGDDSDKENDANNVNTNVNDNNKSNINNSNNHSNNNSNNRNNNDSNNSRSNNTNSNSSNDHKVCFDLVSVLLLLIVLLIFQHLMLHLKIFTSNFFIGNYLFNSISMYISIFFTVNIFYLNMFNGDYYNDSGNLDNKYCIQMYPFYDQNAFSLLFLQCFYSTPSFASLFHAVHSFLVHCSFLFCNVSILCYVFCLLLCSDHNEYQ